MQPAFRKFLHWLLPCLIIFLAAWLYCFRIGDKPLDFDERYSVNIALGTGGPLSQFDAFGQFSSVQLPGSVFHTGAYVARQSLSNMTSAAMNDNGQGIPFFFLLHFWFKEFGITAVSARCLSAVLVILSLILLFCFFRRLELNNRISLFVLAAFAGNGVIIDLAQYVRFYSLGVLLCVASLHLLLSIKKQNQNLSPTIKLNGLLAFLGLLWALLFLSQYLSALIIVPEFIFLLSVFKSKFSFKQFLPLAGAALLPILIWLIPLQGWESLRNIVQLHEHGRLVPPELSTHSSLINLAIALASSYSGAFGQPVNFLQGTGASILRILPAIPAFALALVLVINARKDVWLKLCVWVLISYTAASLLHSILTGHTLLFQVRYWVFGYVFSALLMALAWPKWKNTGILLKMLCLLVITCSFARVAYTSASEFSGLVLNGKARLLPKSMPAVEDYEAVGHELAHTFQVGDTLSFKHWQTAQIVNWYLTNHPDWVQRVDSAQPALIMICRGALKQDTVYIPRGFSFAARPIWKP
ncbi:MAG: glycosyltransferase family 39 protein [Bacteroidetes bacterium]|nr:glycosyltransferase family 39 protein [Bacteroidota bacterium]